MATKSKEVCTKLPPMFKKKLIKELRSGKYKQCVSSLTKGGAYCVMGIVYKVALPDQEVPIAGKVTSLLRGSEKIPKVFLTDQGASSSVQDELIRRNDIGHESFDQLADYIEKEL